MSAEWGFTKRNIRFIFRTGKDAIQVKTEAKRCSHNDNHSFKNYKVNLD